MPEHYESSLLTSTTAGAGAAVATGLSAAPYLAAGFAAFKFFGSIFSAKRRNAMLKRKAEFERKRVRRQALSRFLQGQAEVGQMQATLAGGGLDVSGTGLKSLMETSVAASLKTGYETADETYRNVLSGQTSAVNTLLGAAASAGTTYFNISSSLSSLSHSKEMSSLLKQRQSLGGY